MDRKIYVVGDSMLPTLPKRGWITVHFFGRGEPKNLKVGDIAVYHSKGFTRTGKPSFWHRGNVVHRIVKLDREYAYIKGDNRAFIEKVKFKDIMGIKINDMKINKITKDMINKMWLKISLVSLYILCDMGFILFIGFITQSVFTAMETIVILNIAIFTFLFLYGKKKSGFRLLDNSKKGG